MSVSIADLDGLVLGQALGRSITIDADAAGWGWSISQPAGVAPRMDLFTAVMHELGHVLGFDDVGWGQSGLPFMADELAPTALVQAPDQLQPIKPAWDPVTAVLGAPEADPGVPVAALGAPPVSVSRPAVGVYAQALLEGVTLVALMLLLSRLVPVPVMRTSAGALRVRR